MTPPAGGCGPAGHAGQDFVAHHHPDRARDTRLHGLVLAAGRSSRMPSGQHKLLQLLDGRSVIARTLDAVEQAGLRSVTLVLGYRAGEVMVAAQLPERAAAVSVLVAERFGSGMGASLAAGIAALPDDDAGVLVMLGDMPLVQPDTIRQLVERFGDAVDPARIVLPVLQGGRGHPVLWGHAHRAALCRLDADHGGRDILRRQRGSGIIEIPTGDEGILLDLDDAAAFETAHRMLAARRSSNGPAGPP